MKYYLQTAEKGNVKVLNNIEVLYDIGEGGLYYYEQLADKGNNVVFNQLKELNYFTNTEIP